MFNAKHLLRLLLVPEAVAAPALSVVVVQKKSPSGFAGRITR